MDKTHVLDIEIKEKVSREGGEALHFENKFETILINYFKKMLSFVIFYFNHQIGFK